VGPAGNPVVPGVEPVLDPDAAAALEAPMADSTPDIVDGVALARLYGEPLFKLPEDLYIPPDALEVFLEAFEGPLDLLLYLIRKQHFNVLDIPMAPLTVQYLAYIDQIRAKNLELAAEYLLMAALLIEIKSRMLLPVRKADTGEEVEDPRAELVRRLLEYEQMKLAAVRIDELLKRAKLHAHHRISREELSVREHMSLILKRLQGSKFVEFSDLFDHARGPAVAVVHFLALLELARESLIDITQAAPYAPIYVRLAYTPA
jgi:segregation and condensation protein A